MQYTKQACKNMEQTFSDYAYYATEIAWVMGVNK